MNKEISFCAKSLARQNFKTVHQMLQKQEAKTGSLFEVQKKRTAMYKKALKQFPYNNCFDEVSKTPYPILQLLISFFQVKMDIQMESYFLRVHPSSKKWTRGWWYWLKKTAMKKLCTATFSLKIYIQDSDSKYLKELFSFSLSIDHSNSMNCIYKAKSIQQYGASFKYIFFISCTFYLHERPSS